jgi:hypothetical protein
MLDNPLHNNHQQQQCYAIFLNDATTFVSPSPISFCCGLHNVTSFAETVAYYYESLK